VLAPQILGQVQKGHSDRQVVHRLIELYLSIFSVSLVAQQPINPVLGETFQCRIDNETQVFLEQTSHHPPVSSVLVVGRNFRIHGNLENKMKYGTTQVSVDVKGFVNIELLELGRTYRMNFNQICITGIMTGNRRFFFQKPTVIFSDSSPIVAKLEVYKNKSGMLKSGDKKDKVSGHIY
jgi:hypothetical protein